MHCRAVEPAQDTREGVYGDRVLVLLVAVREEGEGEPGEPGEPVADSESDTSP